MELLQIQDAFNPHELIPLVFGILLIIVCIIVIRKNKKRAVEDERYTVIHPDAVKVYLVYNEISGTELTSVLSVNGNRPVMFSTGLRKGFYVKPGVNYVKLNYTFGHAGVFAKRDMVTTGNVEQVLETQAGTDYMLGYNKADECFTFSEITDTDD